LEKTLFFYHFFGNKTYIGRHASETKSGDESLEPWHSYIQGLVSGKVSKRTTEKKISGVKLRAHSFHFVCLGERGGVGEEEEEEMPKDLSFRDSKLESVANVLEVFCLSVFLTVLELFCMCFCTLWPISKGKRLLIC
jgi:hypothetical protein